MKIQFFLPLIFLSCQTNQQANQTLEISFYKKGNLVTTLSKNEIQASVNSEARQVFEPHMNINRSYVGFAASEIFSKVYGPSWKEEEEVLFTISQNSVETAIILP